MQFSNPFVLDKQDYVRDIDPVKNSIHQYAAYLEIKTGKPYEECKDFVVTSFKKGGVFEFKDVKLTVLRRNEYGDRALEETTVRTYIKEIIDKNLIVAPTWTTYKPTSEEVSFLSEDIEDGIAGRNKSKKLMYASESKGDLISYVYYKQDQGNKKTGNNSVSGAQCTSSTVLYNKTGHSTLTSICRNTSGFGNTNNERIITGNRHYRDESVTLNNINSTVCNTNYKQLRGVMEKYDLHYPSAQEALDCVHYSSDLYWKNKFASDKILAYFEKCTPLQRAAFVYTGDLHHVLVHNESFMRTLLSELIQKIQDKEIEGAMGVVKSSPDAYLFLAHQICEAEVKGIGMEHVRIDNTPALHTLAATILHIAYVVDKYADFIRAVIVTKNVPASVAYLPSMIRRCALASDTDSTLFTVKDWIIWYCGKIDFSPVGIAIQAAMTFFASQSITNVLAVMSTNIGVDKKHLWRCAMKSEFRFDVFVVTMLGKHYFALIGCQEGSVYEKHKVEIKGVHLKSSQITKELTSLSEKMMINMMNDVMHKGSVSAMQYIEEVAKVEKHVFEQIYGGNREYLKAATIKDAESYGLSEEESPFQLHTFWQSTFGKKYGLMPEPPYRTVKISLTLGSPKKIKEWLNGMNDQDLAKDIAQWFLKKEKKSFNTFVIPEEIFNLRGIPDELKEFVDVGKITMELCSSFYLVLETLNLFFRGDKKNTRLVKDVYEMV